MKTKNNKSKRWKIVVAGASACVLLAVVGLSVGLTVGRESETEPVSTSGITFSLPMESATVVKDYSDTELQFNENLNRWEIHLGVDLVSDNSAVFSVADGTVSSVDSNSLDGYIVTIEHADGFVSVYSSLSDELLVSEGDAVSMGQEIGSASSTAANEAVYGDHLHLVMFLDDVEVDPNNYLDLQLK